MVSLMAACYKNEKLRLEEEAYLPENEREDLTNSRIICNRIEESARYLSENDRFIIDNEVIQGKKGKWYMGYLSESTYYRHARKA